MKEKIILVDQDGVFCDFAKGYYELAKRIDPMLYDSLQPFGKQKQYYCHDHIKDDVIFKRGDELANHVDIFDMLLPYDGAIEGMKLLDEMCIKAGFTMLICTAPHTTNLNSYSAKAKWITKYFGAKWLDKVMMVRDKTAVRGTILIDDKPEPLGQFVPEWKHVIMPHSYNLKQQKTNFVFQGWDEQSINRLLIYADAIHKII